MGMDWASLFAFKVSPLELIVRGTLMYWFLLLVFRFVVRRDVGAVGIADILLLVIVADASQNALAGAYTSISEGCVLVGTLIAWNYTLDWAGYRFQPVRRLLEPPPLLLIRQGRVMHRNLRSEHLSMDELMAQLRLNGVDRVEQVRKAYMESDGAISVLKYEGDSRNDRGPRA